MAVVTFYGEQVAVNRKYPIIAIKGTGRRSISQSRPSNWFGRFLSDLADEFSTPIVQIFEVDVDDILKRTPQND